MVTLEDCTMKLHSVFERKMKQLHQCTHPRFTYIPADFSLCYAISVIFTCRNGNVYMFMKSLIIDVIEAHATATNIL